MAIGNTPRLTVMHLRVRFENCRSAQKRRTEPHAVSFDSCLGEAEGTRFTCVGTSFFSVFPFVQCPINSLEFRNGRKLIYE
jgi:hypothetical protein